MNFLTWNTNIDIGFWTRLAKKKIQEYHLDSSPKPLIAKYSLSNKPSKISLLKIDAYSFGDTTDQEPSGPIQYKIQGTFVNTNTIEQFNKIDIDAQQQKLMEKQTSRLKRLIEGKQIREQNNGFITDVKLMIFGDFKKHTFKYQMLSAANPVQDYQIIKSYQASEALSEQQKVKINKVIKSYSVQRRISPPQLIVLKNFEESSVKQFIQSKDNTDSYMFWITDSSNLQKHTGFHFSTILSLFAMMLQEKLVQPKRLECVKIFLMKQYLVYNLEKDYTLKSSEVIHFDLSKLKKASIDKRITLKRKVMQLDLKSFMDDQTLARQAVDLNIKLMKWRLLPSLDIQKIKSKKCLLFGAGTLGCQLSRNLIGWGIKNITFIDYSKVSYSNPVRQTLYEFEDTKGGGRPKAETAAEKLTKIYPQINAKGYSLSIPMPGHYVTKQEHIKEVFETIEFLQKLVQEHDVLFLLLDSREARWLPTVLANKYDKACITVGLGFDSFVIVRHGVSPKVYEPEKHKQRICCYFCNDIITPQNTMKDRTLDQQCTVTRPGLSFVSAAYASQLYISMIHHPLEHHAWADQEPQKLQCTDLGRLPHHIRGNMSDFETHIFYGRAFDKCVACSDYILKQYTNNRQQFMLKVLNDPSFIHEVVELKDQLAEYENMNLNIIQIVDDDEQFGIITSETIEKMEQKQKIQDKQQQQTKQQQPKKQ